MLILDPRSGLSVVVDLMTAHGPFVEACGLQGSRKVPAERQNILASEVRFDLRSEYKNDRHSWSSSSDERNKNNIALSIHGNSFHHAWTCAWDHSIQKS